MGGRQPNTVLPTAAAAAAAAARGCGGHPRGACPSGPSGAVPRSGSARWAPAATTTHPKGPRPPLAHHTRSRRACQSPVRGATQTAFNRNLPPPSRWPPPRQTGSTSHAALFSGVVASVPDMGPPRQLTPEVLRLPLLSLQAVHLCPPAPWLAACYRLASVRRLTLRVDGLLLHPSAAAAPGQRGPLRSAPRKLGPCSRDADGAPAHVMQTPSGSWKPCDVAEILLSRHRC